MICTNSVYQKRFFWEFLAFLYFGYTCTIYDYLWPNIFNNIFIDDLEDSLTKIISAFTIDEINNSSNRECLNYIDVLIDGRYIDELRISSGLKGSENQNIIYFSDKIKPEELEIDQEIEIGDGYIMDDKFNKVSHLSFIVVLWQWLPLT